MSQDKAPSHRSGPKTKRTAVFKGKLADPSSKKHGGMHTGKVTGAATAKNKVVRATDRRNKRIALLGQRMAADPRAKKPTVPGTMKITGYVVDKDGQVRTKVIEPLVSIEQRAYIGPKPQGQTIYKRMGLLLGERIETQMDLVKIVEAGLPSTALDRLIHEVHLDVRMIGPETTVRRRMQHKQPFTVDESERLVRLARVTSMAQELFGNTEAAAQWLNAPSNYLPDAEAVSPLELSQTESGARLVEAMMLQTSHGIF